MCIFLGQAEWNGKEAEALRWAAWPLSVSWRWALSQQSGILIGVGEDFAVSGKPSGSDTTAVVSHVKVWNLEQTTVDGSFVSLCVHDLFQGLHVSKVCASRLLSEQSHPVCLYWVPRMCPHDSALKFGIEVEEVRQIAAWGFLGSSRDRNLFPISPPWWEQPVCEWCRQRTRPKSCPSQVEFRTLAQSGPIPPSCGAGFNFSVYFLFDYENLFNFALCQPSTLHFVNNFF